MWLVSAQCTWVGRESKRLWNSCQPRVLQNGLLTAFSIPLHHSSWTLPLISSPALPIPPLFLSLSPSFFLSSPAFFVAEEDAQSHAKILQTPQRLQPGRAGPLPDPLQPEQPENESPPGMGSLVPHTHTHRDTHNTICKYCTIYYNGSHSG